MVGYCCLVGMWLGAAFVWAVWSSVVRGDGCAVLHAVEIPVLCGGWRVFGREPRVLMCVLRSVCF